MAKQGGLGDGLLIDGWDVSGDIQSLGRVSGGPTAGDFTGIDKSANERIGLLRDGGIETTNFFNKATGAVHEVLKALPLTDRVITYQRGRSLGSPAACLIAKQGNYDYERGEDGTLTASTEALANGYGLQWGEQYTAGRRVDTTATNGTSVDAAASSAFGLVAFLHVVAFTGTSVTVKLQESSDNGGADAWADVTGGAFTAATAAHTAQRIATSSSQTIERYLRVVTTGTFTSADFVVVVCRHEVATSF